MSESASLDEALTTLQKVDLDLAWLLPLMLLLSFVLENDFVDQSSLFSR